MAKQYATAPAMTIDPKKSFVATLKTSRGSIVVELFAKDAPVTVNNFVFLARDKFYDGTKFHRVIADFMVQGGDPEGTGRGGHQGFAASYSTKNGTDLETLDDIPLTSYSSAKNNRYYFAYTVDQYLYQSKENPKEGVGLFGQFGISDGNPNKLHWLAFGGVGGTGLIPGRSLDNWGVGYYYAALADGLKDLPAPAPKIRVKRYCASQMCLSENRQ